MSLREISVHAPFKAPFSKEFNSEAWCVSEMYWRNLPTKIVDEYLKINIHAGSELKLHMAKGIYDIYPPFDFDSYFKTHETEKKKLILNLIHNALTKHASEIGFQMADLEFTYQSCLNDEVDNRWFFKDKFFRSADHKNFARIECYWDLDKFTCTAIIYDKNKKELLRHILLEKKPFLGDFIYWAKAKWIENDFTLMGKDGTEWKLKRPIA
jgi:hypothetical protein